MFAEKLPLFLILLFLLGCASPPAAVDDRSPPASRRIDTHQVEVGDTLYSIAWRYDLTVQHLIAANQLVSPYTINPGEVLTLVNRRSKRTVNSQTISYEVSAGDTLFSIAQRYGSDVSTLARQNNLSPPYLINQGQVLQLNGEKGLIDPGSEVVNSNADSRVAFSAHKAKKNLSVKAQPYSKHWIWKWPAKGRVLEPFNPEKLHKGIKIQSSDSAKVYAAAPGNVVYAGSGLRGYGRLIIIKHSDTLLSAYANNDNLQVKVGDAVTQDDVISNLGSDKVLYFEIRKDGNPVNPVKYLK